MKLIEYLLMNIFYLIDKNNTPTLLLLLLGTYINA